MLEGLCCRVLEDQRLSDCRVLDDLQIPGLRASPLDIFECV